MKVLAAIISGIALSAFVVIPAFASTGFNEAEQSLHESTQKGYMIPSEKAQYPSYSNHKSMNGSYAEALRSLQESRADGIH
ncbi:MAG: hypothetical protein P8X55_08015 [Desulfosarcinaceae bacterium]